MGRIFPPWKLANTMHQSFCSGEGSTLLVVVKHWEQLLDIYQHIPDSKRRPYHGNTREETQNHWNGPNRLIQRKGDAWWSELGAFHPELGQKVSNFLGKEKGCQKPTGTLSRQEVRCLWQRLSDSHCQDSPPLPTPALLPNSPLGQICKRGHQSLLQDLSQKQRVEWGLPGPRRQGKWGDVSWRV